MDALISPNNFCKNASEGTKLPVRARINGNNITLPKKGPIKLPRRRESPWTLEEFAANRALLIMFLCDHCPYVQHLRQEIVKLASCYMEKGLGVLAIKPCHDGPDFVSEEARFFDYPFPSWYDKEQDLVNLFSAVCTPEFFLFKEDDSGESFVLEYHGQFDDSRPDNNVPVTGRDLRIAIDCVLNGLPVPSNQKPSIGCSIERHSDTVIE